MFSQSICCPFIELPLHSHVTAVMPVPTYALSDLLYARGGKQLVENSMHSFTSVPLHNGSQHNVMQQHVGGCSISGHCTLFHFLSYFFFLSCLYLLFANSLVLIHVFTSIFAPCGIKSSLYMACDD